MTAVPEYPPCWSAGFLRGDIRHLLPRRCFGSAQLDGGSRDIQVVAYAGFVGVDLHAQDGISAQGRRLGHHFLLRSLHGGGPSALDGLGAAGEPGYHAAGDNAQVVGDGLAVDGVCGI